MKNIISFFEQKIEQDRLENSHFYIYESVLKVVDSLEERVSINIDQSINGCVLETVLSNNQYYFRFNVYPELDDLAKNAIQTILKYEISHLMNSKYINYDCIDVSFSDRLVVGFDTVTFIVKERI